MADNHLKGGRIVPKLYFGKDNETLEEKRERQLRYRTALDEQKVIAQLMVLFLNYSINCYYRE